MTSHFEARRIDAPRIVAEMLLAHVVGCERIKLYMEADRPASPVELATLRQLVARATRHEPVQYLVGEAWFFGRKFEVNPTTLIPRPSTETLLEHVLQWLRAIPGHSQPLIADIGTGTGCIAVAIAAQLSGATIVATDIDDESLQLARRNAQRHQVAQRIEFRCGANLEPLRICGSQARYDAICSNPPYIPDHEWSAIASNVKHFEPARALRGGGDGLDVIRVLIAEAGALLKPGGELVVEIADCQRDAVLDLVSRTRDLEEAGILKDHEGFWRVLIARRPAE